MSCLGEMKSGIGCVWVLSFWVVALWVLSSLVCVSLGNVRAPLVQYIKPFDNRGFKGRFRCLLVRVKDYSCKEYVFVT